MIIGERRPTLNRAVLDTLPKQLFFHSEHQFTGLLNVYSSKDKWSFSYYQGRILWATGGRYKNPRFRRLWYQFCKDSSTASIEGKATGIHCSRHYYLIAAAVNEKLIEREQCNAIVNETLQEVIFDILQQEAQEYLTYTTATVKTSYTSYPTIISLQRPDRILPPAQQLWEAWKALDLEQYSPNFVPVIEDFDLLYRTLSSKTYTTLTKAIDGRRSLRDLSMLFRQHLLRLGSFLLPYIRQGAIDLKAVSPYTMLASFPPTSQQLVPQPFSPSEILTQPVDEQDEEPTALQTSAKPFLVACVDDSAYAGNQMRRIVERAGYQYFWIRESSQALPALIERQPDLIFLDWMMPPANGYDVCSQIRQAAQLKHTPIVVLTSKDTLVERIRAKLAAANEFMTKPIQPREVLATLHRHFPQAEAASVVGDGA